MEAEEARHSADGRVESGESRRVIALVKDVDAARTALRWAVHNIFRFGDAITLLHVYPHTRSKNKQKQRIRRLNGFQLALSFKDLCLNVPEAKVEIIVTEGDQGTMIMSLIERTGASMLLVGIHDQSFIYKVEMINNCINRLNCRVLAVKQSHTKSEGHIPATADFSQIEMCSVPEQRGHSQLNVVPNSLELAWRSRRSKGECRGIILHLTNCMAAHLQSMSRYLWN